MLGLNDLTVLFGVTRRSVDTWRTRDALPEPDDWIGTTPIWRLGRILAWADSTGRTYDVAALEAARRAGPTARRGPARSSTRNQPRTA